ncbi:MAG: sugar transferase, partial [Chloroflexi bacterium]|nr:sugar transferase [Chloroflexota bacterium]
MPKRAFDLVVASVLLGLNLPVLLLAALLIKLESPGPVFHRARRVGKDGKLFTLYKLRTMLVDAPSRGPGITRRGDPRVTRLGRVLRYSKIDEFPQLLNVLRGEMSLVGPRPEDPRFVAHYTPEQRRVLSVRPGIASPAAVKYFEEEALLAGAGQDVEAFYLSRVLPDKLRLDLEYLERQSLWLDAGVLAGALAALLSPKGEARPAPRPLAARAPHRAERPSLRRAVQRYAPRVLVDAAIVLASLLLAWMARSVTAHLDLGPALAFSLVAAAAYCGANGLFLLYQRMWRYASAGEVVFIYSAVAVATALLAGVVFLWPGERPVPVSVVPLMGSFAFAGFVGVRYRRRLWAAVRWRWRALRGGRAAPHTRVLAVGAREAGGMVAWRFLNEREGERYELVGFADDDPAVQGMRLHGVPVLGDWRAIPSLVARHRVDLLVVALDGLSGREVRQLLDLCGQTPAAIKVLPSFFEQMRANRHVPALRRMVPEDLLGRSSVEIDRQACRGLLACNTVLVTGGACSIGSELSSQIAT